MTRTQITFSCGILSARRLVPLDDSDIELDELNQEETEGKEEDQTKVTYVHSFTTHMRTHTARHCMSDAHIVFPLIIVSILLSSPVPRRWLKEELQKPQGLPLVMCGRRHESSFPMFGQRGSPCCN